MLVVDGSRVGIQIARNGRNVADEISERDLIVQTIFEKVFSTNIKSQTSQDIKAEVILGALRDVLLVCEICKVSPGKELRKCKYLNTVHINKNVS